MKRFHLHLSVEDLEASIRFYSALFAAPPAVRHSDYAKWMIEDPRVNFAISKRHRPVDVNHLGFQVDSGEELQEMQAQLLTADSQLVQEIERACCYAKSDKYWVTDPSGIAWECFHTLGTILVYGDATPIFDQEALASNAVATTQSACCAPAENIAATTDRLSCCS